jgi:hypothetical protein
MRARKASPFVLAAAGLILAGAANASTTSYKSGPLTATFTAGTHHPNCKQYWPVTVTARYQGKLAHATAYYQFLYGGQVVGTVNPYSGTPRNPHNRIWHFYGGFTDDMFGPFGARAVGHPLTVRAVVQVSHYTAYPSYAVTVVSVPGCKP